MAIEKQKLILLIGGIILGIAAIVMGKIYMDQKVAARTQDVTERAKMEIANQTAVLVAKQDIPQGAVIDSGMLDTSIIPNKFVQPQAVSSLDRIAGMVAVAPISKGEQVSLSKLTKERRVDTGGGLAGATPSGKRAISITADNIASLSGMVNPGDYVDVLAIIQVPMQGQDGRVASQVAIIPLFQNVLVLAVGQNIGAVAAPGGRYAEAPPPAAGGGLITLALGPQEANLVAFVQEQGKMRLLMRSPADAKVEPLALATWDTLLQYIMPQRQKSEPEEKRADTAEYVEVLRGLNKEKVPLSK